MSQNMELMKEYELCQQSAQAIGSRIWQVSSLPGLGSVAGIVLVAGADNPGLAVFPAAIVLVGAGFLWWGLAQRWWSVQHVRFTRMIEIERILQRAGQASYVQYLNDITDLMRDRKRRLSGRKPIGRPVARLRYTITLDEASELRRINWPNYYRSGPRDFLKWLPWVNFAVWLIYTGLLLLAQ